MAARQRLGQGELTMHYRRYVEDGEGAVVRQPIECAAGHGCITAVIEDVGCAECQKVAERAELLARECGCRQGHVHRVTAQVQIQNERKVS